MSEVIHSGKIIKRPDIVLDPVFTLPPGIIDVRTKTQREIGEGDENELYVDPTEAGDEEDVVIDLPTPQDMRVVSKITRVKDDGTVVVDVVIETSDIPGVTAFETRLTKA